jgi:hypothetical protein
MSEMEALPLVEVTGSVAKLQTNGGVSEFEIKELPENFIQWQLDYKRGVYDAIERNEYVRFNAGHLPVVGTWSEDSTFPNLANKGVGFTPKDEHIEHYLSIIEAAVSRDREARPADDQRHALPARSESDAPRPLPRAPDARPRAAQRLLPARDLDLPAHRVRLDRRDEPGLRLAPDRPGEAEGGAVAGKGPRGAPD